MTAPVNKLPGKGEVSPFFRQRCVLVAALLPAAASAHVASAEATPRLGWGAEPWVVACLALSLLLYGAGTARLWPRQVLGRRAMLGRAGWFAAGWLAMAAALASPLDPAGGMMFAAHMVQHELLMIVAAPLLVLGQPFGPWMWALPGRVRGALGRAVHWRPWQAVWRTITAPLPAWLIHFAGLWVWHAPPLFQLALRSDTVHAWQHASFLFPALLFWWAVLGARGPRLGPALVYLFTTMMHTGALGALFAMSDNVWYPAYGDAPLAFGLTPLEDQQLGGLIMWVPGGLAYVIAGLVLCLRWLGPVKNTWTGSSHPNPGRS
ncbi:cytochrome c oxidase assembly protein [Pseudoduganella flava]|uniref:Cytochrome c oxidase assembly protein n=2 Tax=Pseudoduganella flava TaxID=871742 RepID=A0ABX6FST4_9BURK|nr:cytochrome c oxidase assembly protein [Pseudoduganella flava]